MENMEDREQEGWRTGRIENSKDRLRTGRVENMKDREH